LALPLDDVVDLIPPEKLKWAWGQVTTTVRKNQTAKPPTDLAF
jgi:hypothetical protein